jgi:hypothetical protein
MTEEAYSLAFWNSTPRVDFDVTDDRAEGARDPTIHDKAVGHVYADDRLAGLPPLSEDLQVLGTWPTVAGTIFNKLYQNCGLDPSTPMYVENSITNLRLYFAACPYWNQQITFRSSDAVIRPDAYEAAVKSVRTFCQDIGLAPDNDQPLLGNIKRIAQFASEAGDLREKNSVLCNSSIFKFQDRLHIIIVYSVASFEADPVKGRYRAISQDLAINFGHSLLNFAFCNRHANRILGYGKKPIEEWQSEAAANSRPENTSQGWPKEQPVDDGIDLLNEGRRK